MKKEKDIFDRIMELPVLRIFNPFYKKNKEILLYLFFGCLTFIVSIASFEELILFIFITNLGMNSMAVKVVAQVIVIVLNYVISKLIVFKK